MPGSEPPNPDVAIADRIAVVLQNQRALWRDALEVCRAGRVAGHRNVVLNEHAIVQDDKGTGNCLSIRGDFRWMVDDVVSLPFPRLARCVDERRVVLIKGAGLTVEVSLVFKRIEHLDFVAALQINTAVATLLPMAFDLLRSRPLDVQLHIAELFFRHDAARAVDLHRAVAEQFPLSFGAFGASPLRQIPAVEQYDRIGWRRARIDDGRLLLFFLVRGETDQSSRQACNTEKRGKFGATIKSG